MEFQGNHPSDWPIGGGLPILTGVGVWAVTWEVAGTALLPILLGFAATKAMMVALYFIHPRYEWARERLIHLQACAPLVLVLVFAFGLLPGIGGIPDFLPF